MEIESHITIDGKFNKLNEAEEKKFFAYGPFEIIAPSDRFSETQIKIKFNEKNYSGLYKN